MVDYNWTILTKKIQNSTSLCAKLRIIQSCIRKQQKCMAHGILAILTRTQLPHDQFPSNQSLPKTVFFFLLLLLLQFFILGRYFFFPFIYYFSLNLMSGNCEQVGTQRVQWHI